VSRNFRSGLSEILMKRWCKLASIFLGILKSGSAQRSTPPLQ
jgi:hypothetical protein